MIKTLPYPALLIALLCTMLSSSAIAQTAPTVIDTLYIGSTATYKVSGQDGSSFFWEVDDGPTQVVSDGANNITITWGLKPGFYNFSVTEVNTLSCQGVPKSARVWLVTDSCVANILADTLKMTIGETLKLRATQTYGYSYEWVGDGISDPYAPTTEAQPSADTTITLHVISPLGDTCSASIQVEVVAYPYCEEPYIYIPNAFTPTLSENNVLLVRGPFIKELDFTIFNRWGNVVYQGIEPTQGWDGTYKGKAAQPGVYVYSVKARCFDDQVFLKQGNVTLIK